MSMDIKSLAVAAVGIVSFLYLLNPTAGFIEIIPDWYPLIGNLDEATAVALLISALGYFGIQTPDIFGKK